MAARLVRQCSQPCPGLSTYKYHDTGAWGDVAFHTQLIHTDHFVQLSLCRRRSLTPRLPLLRMSPA